MSLRVRRTSLWRPLAKVIARTRRRGIHGKAIQYLQNENTDWTESQRNVRDAITKICSKFTDDYWAKLDQTKLFPTELHATLAREGWLGICIPQADGGSELGIAEAAVMMQTISESGGGMTAASSVHMNIFGLEPVVKFGTEEQRKRWLLPLIAGKERACFGVTEPNTGLDTLKLQSLAKRDGDHYALSGQKIWISTAQNAQKILILVRTTPRDQVQKPSQGLSLFYTDLKREDVHIKEIKKMGRHAVDTNELFFENWRVPAADLIERILIGAEALGLGFAALRKAAIYARDREVSIGKTQGIQHPLSDSWMKLEAARLMIYHAARMYDQGYTDGDYSNSAKYLAAEAAFEACERAVLSHGVIGYGAEFHVERYLREVFIPRIAPVSREMILNYIGERVLGLPRSY